MNSKTYKVLMTLITLFCFSISQTSFASSVVTTTATASTSSFSDIKPETLYTSAINYLKDQGIVSGYKDGTFQPDANINRAEFLKIVLKAKGYEGTGTNCFKDVKAGQWFTPYVCQAKQLGFIQGYTDKTFKPEQNITFAEASKIIDNVMAIATESIKSETWYQQYVTVLGDMKAIPITINSFDKNLTRSEMAEMIWRIKTNNSDQPSNTYNYLKRIAASVQTDSKLQAFTSCDDMKSYVSDKITSNPQSRYFYMTDMGTDGAPATNPTAPKAAESVNSADSSGHSSSNYSQTNVQVAGVDEADVIKNDNQYIYIVSGNSVRVVNAYPPNQMAELDKVSFDDANFSPSELYVDGNILTVVGTSWNRPVYWPVKYGEDDWQISYYNNGYTKVFVFDITNRSAIKLSRQLDFEGDYVSSRKINDMVYVVTDRRMHEYQPMPLYYDSKTEKASDIAKCTDVLYNPTIVDDVSYLTVAGIPTTNNSAEISKEVVIGSGQNIYASTKNLYVAETEFNYGWRVSTSSTEETTIHKFSLGDSAIKYEGSGKVPGTILNQFSMDENGDYFRIATTKGSVWDTQNPAKNNLYVLDKNMNKVGSLEGLAPGEKIYSVRFMGDRAYVVTFKKTDPLFVIGLSDSKNPKVLGKLKIPGYSDYLHPYDETHIIGFGKEATDASEDDTQSRSLDFAWYQGLKIAMFDVSDVNNPKELHKMVLGDRGTDSELLYNHKALLFDKSKDIMAFPVKLAQLSDTVKNNPATPASTYGDYVFQGAYILGVSIADGFTLKGRITQYADTEVQDKSGSYWYGDKDISRILYIGSYFYTISQTEVLASTMSDLKEAGKVILKEVQNVYNGFLK